MKINLVIPGKVNPKSIPINDLKNVEEIELVDGATLVYNAESETFEIKLSGSNRGLLATSFANTSAGLAATTSGEGFLIDNGDGTVTVYLNDGGSAVEQWTLITANSNPSGGELKTYRYTGITTNNDPTLLTPSTDESSLGIITIDSDTAMVIKATVVGRSDLGESAGYLINGIFDRGVDTETARIRGIDKTTIFTDNEEWDVQLDVDTSVPALTVSATGSIDANVSWVADIFTTEVSIISVDPDPEEPPENVTLPEISGLPQLGETLTTTTGTWINSPQSFSVQWYADGISIPSAMNTSYVLTSSEVGKAVTVVVTAHKTGFDPVAVTSLPTEEVTAGLTPIVNLTLPVISGLAQVGEILTATNGTWEGEPTSFIYQWRTEGVNVPDASSSTYTLVEEDAGKAVTVLVSASKLGVESVSAESLPTEEVVAILERDRTASSLSDTQIHSGHSLTDSYVHYGLWPGNYRNLVTSLGVPDSEEQIIRSTIPGSSMQHRFEQDSTMTEGERPYADANLFDTLVITEGGPPANLDLNREGLLNTIDYFSRFTAKMIEDGKGNDVALWTIWPSLNGAGWPYNTEWDNMPFRDALPGYEDSFKYIADYTTWKMHQLYPSLPSDWKVWIVPGHKLMERIYDDIGNEVFPGATDLESLFKDDIHPDSIIEYGLSCLVATCLYQVNLAEAENVYIAPVYTDPGSELEHPAVSQAQAEYFWDICWEIFNSYGPAGGGGSDGNEPRWSFDEFGDLMPNWTLDNPVTSPVEPEPEEPEEAALPDDILGLISPTESTFTTSPALPSATDGFRPLTTEIKVESDSSFVYFCIRGKRIEGGPPAAAFVTLGTGEFSWDRPNISYSPSDYLSGWFFAYSEGDEDPNNTYDVYYDVPIDTNPHIVEGWYDSATGTYYQSVDGEETISAVAATGLEFNNIFMAKDGGVFDIQALTALDRIPTTEERAGIREYFLA